MNCQKNKDNPKDVKAQKEFRFKFLVLGIRELGKGKRQTQTAGKRQAKGLPKGLGKVSCHGGRIEFIGKGPDGCAPAVERSPGTAEPIA